MTSTAKIIAVILVNLVLTGLVGELVVRAFYEPLDYLEPERADDEVLSFRLLPGSGAHDAWGFRNLEVPESAAVVALGDSWTYGIAAKTSESWPSWLARNTHQRVYNLGVYGYGPTDYLHLVNTRALSLEPNAIVLGLSYATDFLDAYVRVYRADAWAHLRSANGLPGTLNEENSLVRDWNAFRGKLRRQSLLFQVIERGPIGRSINELAGRYKVEIGPRCLLQTVGPFETILIPDFGFRGMNLEDPRVREGIEISLAVLEEIAETTARRDVRLLIALFPTKERVFAGRLTETTKPECLETLHRLIEFEAKVDSRIKSFLEDHDIEYVELMPALERVSQEREIFPRSPDLHPNGAGYRVISDVIAEALVSGRTTSAP